MVHSKEKYKIAVEASEILFGNPTKRKLETILQILF